MVLEYQVEFYEDNDEFQKGLNELFEKGFELHSWQDGGGPEETKITAVFKRRKK
jgi:hypothetical protein